MMDDLTKLDRIAYEQWKKGKNYADWQKERYKIRVENYETRVKTQGEEDETLRRYN